MICWNCMIMNKLLWGCGMLLEVGWEFIALAFSKFSRNQLCFLLIKKVSDGRFCSYTTIFQTFTNYVPTQSCTCLQWSYQFNLEIPEMVFLLFVVTRVSQYIRGMVWLMHFCVSHLFFIKAFYFRLFKLSLLLVDLILTHTFQNRFSIMPSL